MAGLSPNDNVSGRSDLKDEAGSVNRQGTLQMHKRTKPDQPRNLERRPTCGRWVEKLQDLPDLRWAKVAQARQNIVAHLYEREDFVEGVLPTLAQEVGAVLEEDLP
jgi:hypothetical protein